MCAPGPLHYRFACDACPERQTGSDPFGGGDNIWLDAKVFDRPPLPGPPHTTLDFIRDQQNAVLVAQFAQRREEAIRWDHVSALSLDWFH
jgi:hypothetical protein